MLPEYMEETRTDPPRPIDSNPEVVGEYDSLDGTAVFVVTDTARDDAWIAMSTDSALDLDTVR